MSWRERWGHLSSWLLNTFFVVRLMCYVSLDQSIMPSVCGTLYIIELKDYMLLDILLMLRGYVTLLKKILIIICMFYILNYHWFVTRFEVTWCSRVSDKAVGQSSSSNHLEKRDTHLLPHFFWFLCKYLENTLYKSYIHSLMGNQISFLVHEGLTWIETRVAQWALEHLTSWPKNLDAFVDPQSLWTSVHIIVGLCNCVPFTSRLDILWSMLFDVVNDSLLDVVSPLGPYQAR